MSTERRSGAWLPGEAVRDHVLMQRLGRGGMGEVWRARHVPTGAVRAIKVLPLVEDAETLLRFQREGEAMAKVGGHPNLVQVHTTGVHAGRPWLAMELVEGGDLAARLEDGPLAPAEAARLVRDVARAVAHAHARGVIHRDIKPANVLLEGEVPRLTDFGLARIAGEKSLTATGTILGTPSHMAPEQARGERADERTDVYGLGALLHHALSGRPPVRGETPMQVVTRVIAGELDPAPAGVPAALLEIRRRALAYEPRDRWPDAASLAQALEGWLSGAAPAPRRRWLAPLAALAVIGLAVLLRLSARGPLETAPAPAGLGGRASDPPPAPTSPDPQLPPPPEESPWVQRYRAGPGLERRPELMSGEYARGLTLTEQAAAGTVASATLIARARPLADAGSAPAQRLLGQLLLERASGDDERQAALELLWRAARQPQSDKWAWLLLAKELSRRGDPEGARWVLAEGVARLATSPQDKPDVRAQACALSVRLGTPGDLGRAIRLVRAGQSPLREEIRAGRAEPEVVWLHTLLTFEHHSQSGRGPLADQLLVQVPSELIPLTRLFLARSQEPALRELAAHPTLPGARFPAAWLTGPPLEQEWSEADRYFRDGHVRDRDAAESEWVRRFRSGPDRAKRPPDERRLPLREELSGLVKQHDAGQLTRADLVPQLEAMAAQGLAQAQVELARLERDPATALELLWTAGREPHPDGWADVELGQRLLAAGDTEGARWCAAEGYLRVVGSESAHLIASLCELSLRLGQPADVARVLRLLEVRAPVVLERDLRSTRRVALDLLHALCRQQGWKAGPGPGLTEADERALRAALDDTQLEPATRLWLARSGDLERARRLGVEPQEGPPLLEARAEADLRLRESPYVERFRRGPPRRHLGEPERLMQRMHVDGLRARLSDPQQREQALEELRALAATGECAPAERTLAEQPETEPQQALELLWRTSRDPHSDRWGGLALAHRLTEAGDVEGARWLVAEACARAARGRDDRFLVAAIGTSLGLGEPPDVERGLALLQRYHGSVLARKLDDMQHVALPLLRAICRAQGWGGAQMVDEATIRTWLADPRWGPATRWWLRGTSFAERFGLTAQDVMVEAHEADRHFKAHPPDEPEEPRSE